MTLRCHSTRKEQSRAENYGGEGSVLNTHYPIVVEALLLVFIGSVGLREGETTVPSSERGFINLRFLGF